MYHETIKTLIKALKLLSPLLQLYQSRGLFCIEMFLLSTYLLVMLLVGTLGEDQCKDMLQGYLTGQLTSALGTLQVDALRKEIKTQIQNTEAICKKEIAELKTQFSNISVHRAFSTSYIRWGKKTCPRGASLVYSGYAAGEHYTHTGGGADTLCLPSDPEWGKYTDGTDGSRGYVYGTEYQFSDIPDPALRRLHDHDVPCSLCKVSDRTVTQMIAGRKTCYQGWLKEYSGYLVSAYYGHKGHSGYKCVDESPDSLRGGHADKNGNLFYPVEARCGSLKCPPYVEGRELACVVCSI